MHKSIYTAIISAAAVTALSIPMALANTTSPMTYTVQSGDSLWKISQKYNVSVAELTSYNQVSNPNSVYVGETISIPLASYTVKAGDSLSLIAKNYGVTTAAIASQNNLSNINMIYVGQVLQIPLSVSTPAQSSTAASSTTTTPSTTASAAPSTTSVPARSTVASNIITTAEKYEGPVPYVWGGTSPSGWDCSGFVYYVFQQNGITVPRVSADMFNAGTAVSESQLQPADLVFFQGTTSSTSGISHVGIYIGNGEFINESSSQNAVVVASLSNTYWAAHYAGAKRVF